jgi:RNA polymerase sigma factor (sigma-70 family)
MELADHLFRHEAGRMVAVLTRIFGVQNLALAEDVVQDAFCRALEVWAFGGVPENPSAWLMAAAKNRALDVLRREKTARTYEPELSRWLQSEWTLTCTVEEMFADSAIKDDQLRMMFSCCHPRLPEEAQVMLILHILCGFGIAEVASAFVTSYTAVEKRIPRAKKVLAGSKKLFDTQSSDEFSARLPAVQRALYLLFNEGYHGASAESAVRAELCEEAIRLAKLLLEHPLGARPSSYALSALMCFNKARLPARAGASGKLNSLFDQDRSLWNQRLIGEGLQLLELSAEGTELTEYHLEARIAAAHASAPTMHATNWQ